jgi:glucose/arabinose dehydrogenase
MSVPRQLVRVVLAALAGCLACAAPAAAAPRLERIGGDFDSPLYVAAAPGDYSRLYVVEQGGLVRVVRNGVTLSAPFADLRGDLTTGGERGLLSIAFPPDFARSRLLYAYFTDAQGDVRIEQLRAASADRADPSYRRTTLEIPHPGEANHNGGTARFGPDGYLWLGTGDGGGGYDSTHHAQDRGALLGKILRIAPRPGGGYNVPPGNPFGNAVWSYGLRNPFRFSFDRLTGDLVIGDVGQSTTEEIDWAPAAAARGRGWNYAWPTCEGSFVTDSKTTPCPSAAGVKPVIDRFQSDGWATINAGVVVRDRSLPSLYGRLVYGDTDTGMLRSARLRSPHVTDDAALPFTLPGVAGINEDNTGCVYLASLSGGVYRLVENATGAPCRPASAPPSSGQTDHRAPRLRVRVPARQRVLRNRGLIAYARSDEAGSVAISARLVIGRRSYRLHYRRVPARAGKRLRLKATLTARGARALRRALRRHRRARVRVALRARDAAANRSRLARRTVRVVR